MALFLFKGPPIYAGGSGENASIVASVPAPSASMVAFNVVTPITWSNIPDQVFTQGVSETHNLSAYSSVGGGYPLRVTLAPGSPSLPAGITWNEATESLVAVAPPTVTTVANVILRATSGILLTSTAAGAAPSASLAATATGAAVGNVVAAVTANVPRPSAPMTAEATQNPPPTGIGYPTTYTVPTDAEYVFSDTSDGPWNTANGGLDFQPTSVNHHQSWQVPNYAYASVYGHTNPHPGFYCNLPIDAGVMWKNVGGDWADVNNLFQGSAAFRGTLVTAAAVHGTGHWYSWDINNLVSLWLNHTFRNAGLWMRGNNTNTITWASRFNTTLDTLGAPVTPYLMLTSTSQGQVRVDCARNIGVDSSGEGSLAGAVTFQTSGTAKAGLLNFDLSGFSLPDITGAVLWAYTTDQFSNQTVNIFRCVNPGNQEGDHNVPIDSQHIGVAGNYPLDVGIESDPSVLFVQKFVDDTIQPSGLKLYEDMWLVPDISGNSGWQLIRTPDGNGFTKLAGIYNGARGTASTSGGPGCYWSPWRGHPTPASGLRLKPYIEVEELYMRYYLMFGNDWDPMPHGGKMLGFDGRYTTLNSPSSLSQPYVPWVIGMSRGNSGSGTDGITGWSVRANFSRQPTPGSPCENMRGLGGSDSYHADMTNSFGGQMPFLNHYLGMMRKGQWNCVEEHVKMNSVSNPSEQPRSVTSLHRLGTVATVILRDAEDLNNPLYQVGQTWCIGGTGVAPDTPQYWQGEHIITSIIDDHTFTYDINALATSTPNKGSGPGGVCGWWGVPSVGRYDGVFEGWINGRLAGRYSGVRWRHTARRPTDGGLLGVDACWFVMFVGGAPDQTIGNPSLYIANIIAGTSYIGPMVGYP